MNIPGRPEADIFLYGSAKQLRLMTEISDTKFVSISLIGKRRISLRNISLIGQLTDQKFSQR